MSPRENTLEGAHFLMSPFLELSVLHDSFDDPFLELSGESSSSDDPLSKSYQKRLASRWTPFENPLKWSFRLMIERSEQGIDSAPTWPTSDQLDTNDDGLGDHCDDRGSSS